MSNLLKDLPVWLPYTLALVVFVASLCGAAISFSKSKAGTNLRVIFPGITRFFRRK